MRSRPMRAVYIIIMLGICTLACEAPRKKLPDVVVHTAPYVQRITPDSVYVQALLLGADAVLTGDTTALSPGAGRFEITASCAFVKPAFTAWQTAGPENGYRITGAFVRPEPCSKTYIRCHFGPNRGFIRPGRVDSLVMQ